MDPKHSADTFKHLEKQGEVLMESYRAMSYELHRLQVEEEMLMKKLYAVMSAEGLIKEMDKEKVPCDEDMHENPCDEDMHEKEKNASEEDDN